MDIKDNPYASLLGGARGEGTSGYVSPEVLARMSADEQIMWCMRGRLAEALGPDGDSNAFAPVIIGMLNNNQIDWRIKRGIFMAMGTILAAKYNEGMVQEIMQRASDGNRGAQEAMGTILAAHYNEGMVQEIMQRASDGNRGAQEAMGTILAAKYNEGMVQEIMQQAREW